jgi:hypothetical protein
MMNVHPRPAGRHRLAGALMSLIALILLAACGGSSKPAPTSTPAASTLPTTTTAGTESASLTAGQLADMISVAWSSVQTIRIERGAAVSATPTAGAPNTVTRSVTEIDAAGHRRLQLFYANGASAELVAVNGLIWARGDWPFPAAATGTPTPDGWFAVDPTIAEGDQAAGPIISAMLAPISPVYSGLSESQRQRGVEPLGPRSIDGRTCDAYRIPATTQTGQSYDVIISLGADHLPCAIETTGLGQDSLETYTFNEGISIVAPVATPVALS